jgi:hypothetical protein
MIGGSQKISVGKILFERDFPQESVGFVKDGSFYSDTFL